MKKQTSKVHTIIFGSIFTIILGIICFSFTYALKLQPMEAQYHTYVMYYENEFSTTSLYENTKTALYLVNLSEENLYAKVTESDKTGKKVSYTITIDPESEQFFYPEGATTINLTNQNGTAKSVAKFSRWYMPKRMK